MNTEKKYKKQKITLTPKEKRTKKKTTNGMASGNLGTKIYSGIGPYHEHYVNILFPKRFANQYIGNCVSREKLQAVLYHLIKVKLFNPSTGHSIETSACRRNLVLRLLYTRRIYNFYLVNLFMKSHILRF